MTSKSLIPVGTEQAVAQRATNPFAFLQHEIDRLPESFVRGFPVLTPQTMLPSMDVSETDKIIEIKVAA